MTCSAKDCVDRIAFRSCEVVSFEMSVFFEMAYDWLNGTAPSHFTSDGG